LCLVLGPFLHPRTRPLAMNFLRWLHGRGVDVAAMLDRMYGYTLPTQLKSWLWTAVISASIGWVGQMFGTVILGGEFNGKAVILFTLVTIGVCALFLGALVSIAKTRQVPSRRDIQQALASPQGFDRFLQVFGEPSSPAFSLIALFVGATILGIAPATTSPPRANAVAFRVFECGGRSRDRDRAGIAFQVVVYMITKLGALVFAFFARPVVAVGRAGLVAAVPGITNDNAEHVLGVATSFNGLVAYTPYVLAVGAFGLAHVVMGMVFGIPVLII
jgi:hypothetical protein